jgi:hypothetical protein
MQSLLNSIKYTSKFSIESENIRENLKIKNVLQFLQALEQNPNLTKIKFVRK